MEHSYLHRIGAYIVKARMYLTRYKIHRYGMNPCNTHCIFINHGHDGTHAVASEGRNSFEVGLNTGASARVAAGYGEYTAIMPFHIFHFSRLYALSQNIHSRRVQVKNISVILSRTS